MARPRRFAKTLPWKTINGVGVYTATGAIHLSQTSLIKIAHRRARGNCQPRYNEGAGDY